MSRSALGYLLLLAAAVLLVVEALSVLARFAAFAGASEMVAVRRWQWWDVARIAGAVACGVAAYRLLRSSGPPNRTAL